MFPTLFNMIYLVGGIAIGAMGYRFLLSRNPALIEKLAAKVAEAKASAKAAVDKVEGKPQ
jgi:hypothetical protein